MARTGSTRKRASLKKKTASAKSVSRRRVSRSRSAPLAIEGHRLVGGGVSFVETPNKGGEITPRYLVLHYTAGKSAKSAINRQFLAKI